MKILQVTGSGTVGTVHAGPVSSVALNLSNEFVKMGHEVDLIDSPSHARRCKINDKVRVHEILRKPRSRTGIVQVDRLVNGWANYLQIRRKLNWRDYHAIHVHEAHHAHVFSRMVAQPLLWTAHSLNWTMDPDRGVGPRGHIARRIELAACRAADQVVVLNEQTREALSFNNVTVVPNGIALEDWPVVNKAEARLALGIAQDAFVVSYFGRIAPEKGVDIYVRAVCRLADQVHIQADAIGSLSGQFDDRHSVSRYARQVMAMSDKIKFRGFIHRDEPEYRRRMAAADLVIIPSRSEPFGLVVLEALACGARVIGSDTGGIRDMLGSGLGRLVPPGNPLALARSMLEEYRKPNRTQRFTDSRHLERFQWHIIGERYLKVMSKLKDGTQS